MQTQPGVQETRSGIQLKNILYATDFSGPSKAALPYALSIARKYGSKIFAVHVVSLSPFGGGSPTVAWQAVAAQAVRESKEAMSKVEPELKGVAHETLVVKGEISAELSSLLEEKQIDLVVMGTHGRTRVSKALMGSVAEKTFRQVLCPVLTVGPKVTGEPETIADVHTILYPTDFSPESLGAAPYAISLAQEHQARLYLLHVVPAGANEQTAASFASALRGLIPPKTEFGCEPRAFVETGDPAEKILEIAEEIAVDIIVLGVKRIPRIPTMPSRFAMATAYKVVTDAPCPVLTVRGEPAQS